MAIAGIGTDIVRVERFNQFIQRQNEALLQRMFTLAELDYALPRKCAGQHLAARFAAKESFVEALGLGLRDGITWHDMEVVRDDLGCPSLKLSGRAAEITGLLRGLGLGEAELKTGPASFGEDTEYLLYVCCTSCYDARSRKIPQAIAALKERSSSNCFRSRPASSRRSI